MIPITILDNFFPDPDKIVDIALQQEYFPHDRGRWPGKRSAHIGQWNKGLFDYICNKILTIISLENTSHCILDCQFHIIEPQSDVQDDPKNFGLIHTDDVLFGGVIYLNKNPQKNTGTSIYSSTTGYELLGPRIGIYHLEPDEFIKTHNLNNSQFVETVNIKNVYNRLVMFSGNTFHGIQTFGNKPRLSLVFFCKELILNKKILTL